MFVEHDTRRSDSLAVFVKLVALLPWSSWFWAACQREQELEGIVHSANCTTLGTKASEYAGALHSMTLRIAWNHRCGVWLGISVFCVVVVIRCEFESTAITSSCIISKSAASRWRFPCAPKGLSSSYQRCTASGESVTELVGKVLMSVGVVG
jgi:hypothetical protein